MGQKESKLTAELRAERGSAAARRLRRTGRVPAVLSRVGGGTQSLQVKTHEFDLLLQRHSSETMLVELDVAGVGAVRALLQEVQHDSLTGEVLHADFMEVSATTKMRVSVPLEFSGTPAGVAQGGVLEHLLRSIEIECLPDDLIESVTVDVSGMVLNTTLLVRDIPLPPAVGVLTAGHIAVAAVIEPRQVVEKVEGAEAEAAEAAAPEAAAAEPAAGKQ